MFARCVSIRVMIPRSGLIVLCLLVLLAAGCTPRNRVEVQGGITTFSFEHRLSRGIFGGTARHVFSLEVDSARLAEARPLAVSELRAFKHDGRPDDLTTLDGFLWYLPRDRRVLVGIGLRLRGDQGPGVMPLLCGDFELADDRR